MGREGDGVEARDNSIRVRFVYQGQPVRERLMINGAAMLPTPANIKYAIKLVGEIKKKISLGQFDYAEYFPDSSRVAAEKQDPSKFGGLADLWLQSKGKSSAATKDQYATAVRFWKRMFGENALVKDLTHTVLAAKIGAYDWPSAKTHNNYMIALRGTLAMEYRGAKTGLNPLAGIANLKVTKKKPDPMMVAERDSILADLSAHYDERVYAYFLWQFYTGMRPEETIALRWSDVDLRAETIRVQRVRTFRGGERDDTKTFVDRDVDLLPQAVDALRLMKPHTFMLRVDRGKDQDEAADIFQNPITRKAWHDERAQRDTYWRPSLKRLGIRWRTAYNTRHTFATAALMTGAAPAYVADQLGHSVKMLLDRYARWVPGNDGHTARDKLRAAMGAGKTSQEDKREIKL